MNSALANAPLIPFSVAGIFILAIVIGFIFTLRDQHARDAGWLHGLGVALILTGSISCMVIGSWNMGVVVNTYLSHLEELAIIAPIDQQQ
ncbi:MAG TPA: hypothetical protein VJ553_02680 [Candidatus Paceibacterota bacterium]|nr:hypothetical protein [Candidatus Paceibacterota bacterium]